MDLRQRVMAACDGGQGTAAVAKAFGVSRAWVGRLKQHRRERGDIVPRPGGGSRGQKIDRMRLAELVRERPDATLAELRLRLDTPVTLWSICRALKQLKLTYKKSPSTPPSRTGPTSPRLGRGGG